MITNFLKKVESKRNSEKLSDKLLISVKDTAWAALFYAKAMAGKISNQIKIFFRVLSGRGKLPDFLIIGVGKCGTSYLWRAMKEHGQIEMAPNFLRTVLEGNRIIWVNRKEVDFFYDENIFKRGPVWYKSLFNDNGKKQGEASVHYGSAREFYHQKMCEYLPEAKLIIVLRNPVERAFSAFNHIKRVKFGSWGEGSGYDMDKNFSENIELDMKSNFRCGGIISEGFYIRQVKNILKYYPRNQLFVVIAEQMEKNPEKILAGIYDFLGVGNVALKFSGKVNVGTYFEKMDGKTAKKLYSLYEPYNRELYKFLGYEIKEWEKAKKDLFNQKTDENRHIS